jgi:hypothetical protein
MVNLEEWRNKELKRSHEVVFSLLERAKKRRKI